MGGGGGSRARLAGGGGGGAGGGGGGGAGGVLASLITQGSNAMMASASSMIQTGGTSLEERAKAGKLEGLHVLQNIMPDWDESLEAFTLPFYQRVVLPSKKNVHIVSPDNPDHIVLLFGKRAKSADGQVTTFSLDFCRPVSCLAAMGIALTSFFGSS